MTPAEFEPAGEWATELADLKLRRHLAAQMGGPEAVAKYKARGRQTARERIAGLLDEGSFRELGRITGKGHYDAMGQLQALQAVNAIIGTGRVEGRKIVVSADDYTIRAGSSEGTISDKWIYAERLLGARRKQHRHQAHARNGPQCLVLARRRHMAHAVASRRRGHHPAAECHLSSALSGRQRAGALDCCRSGCLFQRSVGHLPSARRLTGCERSDNQDENRLLGCR